MLVQRNDNHAKHVALWEKKRTKELTVEDQIIVYGVAVNALEKKATATLSRVTLLVILDRVLHQSQKKFPILSDALIKDDTISFGPLVLNSKTKLDPESIEALRYFLVEFLNVLGRITADILTIPLHEELMKISWDLPVKSTKNDSENT